MGGGITGIKRDVTIVAGPVICVILIVEFEREWKTADIGHAVIGLRVKQTLGSIGIIHLVDIIT